MTNSQINDLASTLTSLEGGIAPVLIETHISWVLLCKHFAYKIKKPIQYPFLDFSTLEKRKYYCEKEIELNSRFTQNIYISVVAITQNKETLFIDDNIGNILDYAVKMRKLPLNRQMDMLLLKGKIVYADILNLAEVIVDFHKHAPVIHKKDYLDVFVKFDAIEQEAEFLNFYLKKDVEAVIANAIRVSRAFKEENEELFKSRLDTFFYRDCHGDLHSRNIFLLPSPHVFDCIEFNDDYREIDVLNDIAFLCMDLDAFGRRDFSDLFLSWYNTLFPVIRTPQEQLLFVYYKSYRANVRAKVNALRARDAVLEADRKKAVSEVKKYLNLMEEYILYLDKALIKV